MARWLITALLATSILLLSSVRPPAEAKSIYSDKPVTVTRVEPSPARPLDAPAPRPALLANDQPFFPIGVTYHFTRHRATWDKDLRLMSQMGLNTVRADLAWRDIMPYFEGNYQFGALDEFLDRAYSYGLYVVPVFSYATLDYNTPWWFALRYQNWLMVGADGIGPFGDYPSFNHPDYRRLFGEYVRQTVEHVRGHPAILAYQILNEPHYPKRPLSDYNDYTVAAFGKWVAERYPTLEALNEAWLTSFSSFAEVAPPRGAPSLTNDVSYRHWNDWREFSYDNLAGFVEEVADQIRAADPDHAVLVAEMSWWWWGEQPTTGASPAHVYRAADVVGFDVYPEGGQHADYYGLNADLLLRLWQKPVWVTELNRKDGNPSAAEIQGFTVNAVERGATGVFYFQWRDTWTDGGAYGLLDARGNKKAQFSAFEATVAWLKENTERLLTGMVAAPDALIVWPTNDIANSMGHDSPAHDVYRTALQLSKRGLQVGLVPEEVELGTGQIEGSERVRVYYPGFRAE